jgi:hypothetical protein
MVSEVWTKTPAAWANRQCPTHDQTLKPKHSNQSANSDFTARQQFTKYSQTSRSTASNDGSIQQMIFILESPKKLKTKAFYFASECSGGRLKKKYAAVT